MPYIDLAGLSRYASRQKERLEREYALLRDMQWLRTEKAGAVSLWPAGGTPLKPVVDFLFTEMPPASGDKSPSNPSTITGVESVKVTRCGKNLLTRNPIYETMSLRGITVSYNVDGSIHLKGTAASNSFPYLWYFTSAPGIVPKVLAAGTTITISLTCSDNNVFCTLNDSSSASAWQSGVNIYPGTPLTHTMSSNVKTAHFGIYVDKSATVDCDVYCQIEFGQTATAWEAPADEDYTIPLNGTYYGGSIDLATGVMTVTWVHQTVTGGATTLTTVDASTLQFRFSVTSGNHVASDTTNLACNRFIPGSTLLATGYASQLYYARIAKSLLDVSGAVDPSNPTDAEWLAAINSWLSSNNIEIAYKLATPYTVQLTPSEILSLAQPDKYTPRLNTVYTDAQAVQAGYVKSPIRDEYELQQAVIAQGGNV